LKCVLRELLETCIAITVKLASGVWLIGSGSVSTVPPIKVGMTGLQWRTIPYSLYRHALMIGAGDPSCDIWRPIDFVIFPVQSQVHDSNSTPRLALLGPRCLSD